MSNTQSSLQRDFKNILIFVGSIWAVYGLELFIPSLAQWGVIPRTIGGLVGIPCMTFLHGGFGHLFSNSVPLVILLVLLAGSRSNFWTVVSEIIVFGGLLLWLLGRPADHIGASLLVYGLISYLIVAGFTERRIIPVLIAIIVFFFFGGSLFWSVLPIGNRGISWEGHLFGAIAGGMSAYVHSKNFDADSTPDSTSLETT